VGLIATRPADPPQRPDQPDVPDRMGEVGSPRRLEVGQHPQATQGRPAARCDSLAVSCGERRNGVVRFIGAPFTCGLAGPGTARPGWRDGLTLG
jgi:hypothetical protein